MKKLITFLTVLLILVFVFSGIFLYRNRNGNTSLNVMKHIENDIGLTFSADSRLDHFFEPDVAIDPIWVAKVVMPVLSYEKMVQSLNAKPIDNTIYNSTLTGSTNWWHPVNIVTTKQYLVGSQTFVRIIVSKEGNEMALYIECVIF